MQTWFLWYLCCPYSHKNPSVQEERFQKVTEVSIHLEKNKVWNFSPITYTGPLIAVGGMGDTWESWEQHDLSILSHCEGILVLTLPGWEESKGVRAEIDFFEAEMSGPVLYFRYEQFFTSEAILNIHEVERLEW